MLRRRRYVFNCAAVIRNYSAARTCPQRARSARVCAARRVLVPLEAIRLPGFSTAEGGGQVCVADKCSAAAQQLPRCRQPTACASSGPYIGLGSLSTAALDLPLPTAILVATARSIRCCWCGCSHLRAIVCLWQSVVALVRSVSGGCQSAGSLPAVSGPPISRATSLHCLLSLRLRAGHCFDLNFPRQLLACVSRPNTTIRPLSESLREIYDLEPSGPPRPSGSFPGVVP